MMMDFMMELRINFTVKDAQKNIVRMTISYGKEGYYV